jgi:hypothetical protein
MLFLFWAVARIAEPGLLDASGLMKKIEPIYPSGLCGEYDDIRSGRHNISRSSTISGSGLPRRTVRHPEYPVPSSLQRVA